MTLHKHCTTADRVDSTGSQCTETEFKSIQALRLLHARTLNELNALKNLTKMDSSKKVCLNQRQFQNQRSSATVSVT